MRFSRYIGIDYSGAQTADSRLRGLQLYAADPEGEPVKIRPDGKRPRNWSRREIADYCRQALISERPLIIGIDHGFSFPLSYMQRYGLSSWDGFLDDFVRHWPTAEAGVSVESLRPDNQRTGGADALRLCEQWTATAKSVFLFDVQGAVAKSTHAGLPWLHSLRQQPALRSRLHFWPFDGFRVPAGRSVIAEVYPSLCRRRYANAGRNPDEQDAWSVAAWLRDMDRRECLESYFSPPLTEEECKRSALEGWILGVW